MNNRGFIIVKVFSKRRDIQTVWFSEFLDMFAWFYIYFSTSMPLFSQHVYFSVHNAYRANHGHKSLPISFISKPGLNSNSINGIVTHHRIALHFCLQKCAVHPPPSFKMNIDVTQALIVCYFSIAFRVQDWFGPICSRNHQNPKCLYKRLFP